MAHCTKTITMEQISHIYSHISSVSSAKKQQQQKTTTKTDNPSEK